MQKCAWPAYQFPATNAERPATATLSRLRRRRRAMAYLAIGANRIR
ncbi:hypothetical protein I545_0131 [Mycobacterium kansasii 662]|uniref:Uncharacterized protein n=1 Tax=Mycobacterium kansasii 662 TaxID=1299326 RepID=X7ZQP5_MYCKA|nr:hypothetical protein I545_0131 [Mycobacterium kansasii 662]KEP43716.1 hypothetical protein MKSMC1_10800 [Mycobacterium kansasii]